MRRFFYRVLLFVAEETLLRTEYRQWKSDLIDRLQRGAGDE